VRSELGVSRKLHPAIRIPFVALVVLAVDQIAKALVRGTIPPCDAHWCAHVRLGPVWMINATNPGGAFSLRSGSTVWVLLALLGVMAVPLYRSRLARLDDGGWRIPIALGLLLGGALGNLVDRLLFGGVTDFLYLGNFITINLADVAVVLGTIATGRLLVLTRVIRLRSRRMLRESL
jgi:signal peptidase II